MRTRHRKFGEPHFERLQGLGTRCSGYPVCMAHHSRVSKVLIDVTPVVHDRELAFWQAVVGGHWPQPTVPEYHRVDLPGQDFELSVQRLGEGPSRIHLDIHTDNLEAEVERLEQVGARRVRQRGNLWVMQDPAGLLFCVIHDAGVSGENGRRWG